MDARIAALAKRVVADARSRGLMAAIVECKDKLAIVITETPTYPGFGTPIKVVWLYYEGDAVEIRNPGLGDFNRIAVCTLDEFERAYSESFGG